MEEEYKKKYEELVKHIKQFHQSVNPEWKRTIESYVPEIKESEDERIRKDLIGYFEVCSNTTFAHHRVSDIIAWLEKQGHDGKKWIYEDVYLKERDQLFQDGIDEVLENPQKYGLKKGNVTPTEDELEALRIAAYEPMKNWSEKLQSLYEKLANCEQGEQKLLNNDKYQTVSVKILDRLYESEKELERLKQDEQKWSEEDESMLQNILECLKNGWSKLPTDILKYESWLKSLKEKYTWKPSNEQIEAFEHFVREE